MDGNSRSMPELPHPRQEGAEKVVPSGEGVHPTGEQQLSTGEAVRQQTPPIAQVSNDASIIAQPTSTTPLQSVDDSASGSQGQMHADDADVIEKQWVERAKDIVASTRNDPRQQSRELSRFKAEYVQKRFNKELKIVEDAS